MSFDSNIQIPDSAYFAIRADGHLFHKIGEGFAKPYDPLFVSFMHRVTLDVSNQFNPICGYTQSDEISFVFNPTEDQFNRRVEKFVSLVAAACASRFSLLTKIQVEFDARVVFLPHWSSVYTYLLDRQEDCFRNCVNSYALYSMVMGREINTSKAMKLLDGLNQEALLKTILSLGVFNWKEIPDGYKYGALSRKLKYLKLGFNPMEQELVEVERSHWNMDNAPNLAVLGDERLSRYVGSVT